MSVILPIQNRFDKSIPDNFGNAEYRAERELLIAIDAIIGQCDLENPVIAYFLDVASVNKYISALAQTDQLDQPVTNVTMLVLMQYWHYACRSFASVWDYHCVSFHWLFLTVTFTNGSAALTDFVFQRFQAKLKWASWKIPSHRH